MNKIIVMTNEEMKAAETVFSIFERIWAINDKYSIYDVTEMVMCWGGVIVVEVEEE